MSQTTLENKPRLSGLVSSGAEESRTPDLIIANDALYQLSYRPKFNRVPRPTFGGHAAPRADCISNLSLGQYIVISLAH